ncbi:hypothetical protein L3X38_018129 [Prunus dulcis]|uniref:Uncharacterized protein n=1 Tax=Prunus dulcis TaxID=3755 RepID=A0AAD4Z9T7_PRUDU|nr:hypothetical protein L3X38_018129 [Prunus dulcis]
MGDDPKQYTESFHMSEHPTPHMENVSHAGTSNAACGTDNLFFPYARTSNAMCGKSNNWGRDDDTTTGNLRFKPVEIVAEIRGFQRKKLAGLDRDVEES